MKSTIKRIPLLRSAVASSAVALLLSAAPTWADFTISMLEAPDGGTIVRFGGSITAVDNGSVGLTNIRATRGVLPGANWTTAGSPGTTDFGTLTLGIPGDDLGPHSSGLNMFREDSAWDRFQLLDDARATVTAGTTYTPGGERVFTVAEFPYSNLNPGTYILDQIYHVNGTTSAVPGPIDFGVVTLTVTAAPTPILQVYSPTGNTAGGLTVVGTGANSLAGASGANVILDGVFTGTGTMPLGSSPSYATDLKSLAGTPRRVGDSGASTGGTHEDLTIRGSFSSTFTAGAQAFSTGSWRNTGDGNAVLQAVGTTGDVLVGGVDIGDWEIIAAPAPQPATVLLEVEAPTGNIVDGITITGTTANSVATNDPAGGLYDVHLEGLFSSGSLPIVSSGISTDLKSFQPTVRTIGDANGIGNGKNLALRGRWRLTFTAGLQAFNTGSWSYSGGAGDGIVQPVGTTGNISAPDGTIIGQWEVVAGSEPVSYDRVYVTHTGTIDNASYIPGSEKPQPGGTNDPVPYVFTAVFANDPNNTSLANRSFTESDFITSTFTTASYCATYSDIEGQQIQFYTNADGNIRQNLVGRINGGPEDCDTLGGSCPLQFVPGGRLIYASQAFAPRDPNACDWIVDLGVADSQQYRTSTTDPAGLPTWSISFIEPGSAVCDCEPPDADADGVPYSVDNCPVNANSDQADADGDGVGDVCDLCTGDDATGDSDADGVCDDLDNCPDAANADQADGDSDGVGDVCDNCPDIFNDSQADIDGDSLGDVCDNCPDNANLDQADADNDGIGDVCEADSDGDGVIDDNDNCPNDENADQGDGDLDGIGDVCDPDDDNDGVNDGLDNCPNEPNSDQADFDLDGQGDACDGDDDNDGVADELDFCPDTPVGETRLDENGCSGQGYVDLIAGEPADYSTSGRYVKAVVQAANDAIDLGLLSGRERAAIVRAAARNR